MPWDFRVETRNQFDFISYSPLLLIRCGAYKLSVFFFAMSQYRRSVWFLPCGRPIKVRCYGKHVEEYIGNWMGMHWELEGNIVGTHWE
jgi:hypothetical protein